MTGLDAKADLKKYLQAAREALLWKLDGLSEYDVRRPMTGTGTNLLGMVKHVATTEVGYFGETFGRPFPERVPWLLEGFDASSFQDLSADVLMADMWAKADESRAQITDFYRRVWVHSDGTIDALPLAAEGRVAWWPPERQTVTLHRILVHLIAETDRHAGHADIVRELIDGAAGLRPDNDNLPPSVDSAWWEGHRAKLEQAAREADAR